MHEAFDPLVGVERGDAPVVAEAGATGRAAVLVGEQGGSDPGGLAFHPAGFKEVGVGRGLVAIRTAPDDCGVAGLVVGVGEDWIGIGFRETGD